MIKAVIPALLIATMAAGPASAAFITGNQLMEHCRNQNRSFLLGYAMGSADHLQFFMPEKVCIPVQVTGGQLVDILCKYVDEHPGMRHLTGEYLAFASLNEAFPCKQ